MTDKPAVYTAHDPADLIGILPTLFGFSPTDSLVGIATHGPRGRFGFRLRIDMPAPREVDEAAALVAGHLRRQDPDGVVLVALTPHQTTAAMLLGAVRSRLAEVPLIAAVRADGRRYWTPGVACPSEGVPYASETHPAVVHAVVEGMEILPDRAALVERFAPASGALLARMEYATDAVLARLTTTLASMSSGDLAIAGMHAIGPVIDRAVGGGPALGDEERALLAVWVSATPVRDTAWALINHDNARRMLQVWTQVARSVVPPFEPAVLCLTSFAAWLSGDGAQALIAVERALEVDPDCQMAKLLLDLLGAGLSPRLWAAGDARGAIRL